MPEQIKNTTLAASLLAAYRETHYGVSGPSGFLLQVDRVSAPLRELQRRHQCDCSVFITACNPHSVVLDAAANHRRQQALVDDLLARHCHLLLPGVGRHPDGTWPEEPSVLALGIDLDEARELGRRHEQNAVVWSGADAVPRLILLR